MRHLITRAAEGLTVFLFGLVLILQTLNVLFRYVGGQGLPTMMWVEEFTTFSFIWIFFLLWHVSDRKGDHFVVDILGSRLPGGYRKGLEVLSHLVALFFGALVVLGSFWFIPATMYPTNSFRWLPMAAVYMVIPVGIGLVLIERTRMLWLCLKQDPATRTGQGGQ